MTTARFKGREPSQDFSLTLTKVQVIFALLVHAVAILSAALGLALWIGRVMVHQEFDQALVRFHDVAKPEISQMIDRKVLELAKEREAATAEVREDMVSRLSTLEEANRMSDERLRRIEDKLDRLTAMLVEHGR